MESALARAYIRKQDGLLLYRPTWHQVGTTARECRDYKGMSRTLQLQFVIRL